MQLQTWIELILWHLNYYQTFTTKWQLLTSGNRITTSAHAPLNIRTARAHANNMMPLILAAEPALQRSPSQQLISHSAPDTLSANLHVGFLVLVAVIFRSTTPGKDFCLPIFEINFDAALLHARRAGRFRVWTLIPRLCAAAYIAFKTHHYGKDNNYQKLNFCNFNKLFCL